MRLEPHELFRERRHPRAIEVAETISNLDVLPFDVAQIAHSFQKSSNPACVCLFRCFNKVTNEGPPVCGLRLRRERPRRRATEQRDELASFPLTEMHPIPHGPGAPSRIISKGGPAR